jgi:molybdate transport system substrate-binding protein
MKLLSTMGVKGVLDAVIPAYAAANSLVIDATFDPTVLMLERVRGGERGDATILTVEGIEALTAEGILVPDCRIPLARSLVGLAVKAGAPRPDISTRGTVIRTLLEARSIVYSRKGQSGIFFAGLIERLGIANEVNAKAIIIPSGTTAHETVAGRAEIAVQQVSELMLVPGIDLLGPLPMDIQDDVVFEGGLFRGAAGAAAARSFLTHLAEPGHASLYRAKGLEPAGAA